MQQITNHIILVRPANFGYNAETAASNAFQNKIYLQTNFVKEKAIEEFDAMAEKLKNEGVNVIVIQDSEQPVKPDAIFPNNWISMHKDGTIVLYPMQAENRRIERNLDLVEKLKSEFKVNKVIDLSPNEAQQKFLEGTGSIVFNHLSKTAYACISPRTDKNLFEELCKLIDYKAIGFFSYDENEKEIYHTNVMMCVAEKVAIVCLDSITNVEEKNLVKESLVNDGLEIIDISFEQMNNFAGNMLGAATADGKSILALSETAFNSLTESQKTNIEKHTKLFPINIDTIEKIGGGSVRCMMAEVFLQPKN